MTQPARKMPLQVLLHQLLCDFLFLNNCFLNCFIATSAALHHVSTAVTELVVAASGTQSFGEAASSQSTDSGLLPDGMDASLSACVLAAHWLHIGCVWNAFWLCTSEHWV